MGENLVRQRKRVPISCLSCRKRKVKCDKEKPACGGCTKNGVAHLCQYLEPEWATNDFPKGQIGSVNMAVDPAKAKQLEDLKQLKSNHERIINNQRKEIEDLKRQLSFTHQLSVDHTKDPVDTNNREITVLTKLNVLLLGNKDPLEVQNDLFFTISPNKNKKYLKNDTIRDYISWFSVIKLDFKLTSLWHKITNMQKIYYIYKMSTAKREPRGKITEIDFTNSYGGKKPDTSAQKCPVVSCDLNIMTEPSPGPRPNTFGLGLSLEQQYDQLASPQSAKDLNIKLEIEHDEVTKLGVFILKKIQNLWNVILSSSRGNSPLNASQLSFLIDFYFNDAHARTSNRILYFYKDEITSVFRKEGSAVYLDFNIESAGISSQMENASVFKMKGLYVALLALIVEESLDILRSESLSDESSYKFQTLFPEEMALKGLGYKGDALLKITRNYLYSCVDINDPTDRLARSMPVLAACVALLNRDIANTRRVGIVRTDQELITTFKILINMVIQNDEQLEIWKDPSRVTIPDKDSNKKLKDLRIHLLCLWDEFIRFLNIMSLSVVAVQYRELDGLMRKAYQRVEEVELSQFHLKYTQSLKSNQLEETTISLQLNYLIAKTIKVVVRGVTNLAGPRSTIRKLDGLISECGGWVDNESLNRMSEVRRFENKAMLHFTNIYVTYIMLLQCEEDKMEELRSNLVPVLFSKCRNFLKFTNSVIFESSDRNEGVYFISALGELLPTVIQIIVALLLRTVSKNKDKNSSDDVYKQLSAIFFSVSNSLISKNTHDLNGLLKKEISDVVTDTMNRLMDATKSDNTQILKLTQLWKFYLTLIESSEKFDFNYTKLHTNIPDFKSMVQGKDQPSPSSFPRCPVSHGNVSQRATNSPGKCPIDHTEFMNNRGVKRKQQFDFPISSPHSFERLESNVRGGDGPSRRPISVSPAPAPILVPMSTSSSSDFNNFEAMMSGVESVPNHSAMMDTLIKSNIMDTDDIGVAEFAPNDLDLSFGDLENLDSDFLQNYNFMDKVSTSVTTDTYSTPYEGFFQ